MIKKILPFILIFSLFFINVSAMPSHTEKFFINDFANVIDPKVEEHIYNISSQISTKTGAQIVVVTVESLDGMTDSDYALKLGREWGVGNKEKNNGFIMLISTGDRALRFEVGYGLEGALPDGKCGRIQDEYMLPYLSQNNYSAAVLNGYDAVIVEVCNEYGIDIPDDVNPAPVKEDDSANIAYLIAAVVLMIIIFSIFSKKPPSSGGRHIFIGGFGGGYRGGGSFGGGGFSGGGGSFGGGGSSRRF